MRDMKRIYCDICKGEITTIYHEIGVDNSKYEVCEKCHIKLTHKLKELSNNERYIKLGSRI